MDSDEQTNNKPSKAMNLKSAKRELWCLFGKKSVSRELDRDSNWLLMFTGEIFGIV